MSNPIRLGEGKYDVECEAIQRAAQAEGVLLMVLDGNRGTITCRAELIHKIPSILRVLADAIEQKHRDAAGN